MSDTDKAQSDKIKKIVERYSAKINDPKIFFAPNIPEKKLRNAIKAYAPLEEGEQPLLLIDDTVWGGAKEGVLLSDRKLYIHGIWQKPQVVALNEITSIKFVQEKSTTKVYINEIDFYHPVMPDKKASEQFSQMISDIAAQLKKRSVTKLTPKAVKESIQSDKDVCRQPVQFPADATFPKSPRGKDEMPPLEHRETVATGPWQTVRVFISSTFRDMHAERDWLVKVVFPELRERMAKRNLYLVDVDLRWGVTEEEAEQGKVLEVCLYEIERCRPFFIGILCERYGFIPSKVPEDIEFIHPWLAEHCGHSLTALEIIYGVLRNPDMAQRSFFYFRDHAVISQIPESKRAAYEAENHEAAQKLIVLKDKIRASGRPVMENYPCCWDAKKKSVVDLDDFGQQVLEDLWIAICAVYPEEAPEADPLTIERQMHEAFAEERSRLHVGRIEQAKKLTQYVHSKDRRPAVITGESGCGKSAFLANWYRNYVKDNTDDFVLAYFIGASPGSANYFRLLRNMCTELKRQFALKEEIPADDKKLSEILAVMLAAASREKQHIVIVIDALDQLLPLEAAHSLGWLLDYMPEKARLIVSTLEGDCLDVLRRHQAEEFYMTPLAESEQRQIVQILLGEWRRKLNEKQMIALLAHRSVGNPLYLRVALEELRLFGRFEQLTERIKSLAEDISGLFDQVLQRLEEDHGEETVAKAFSLLDCSRYGLSETELLQLLRGTDEDQFPRVLWAQLYRSTKMYLVQRGEFINFFHKQLADAVAARYPDRENTHLKLAGYFGQAVMERKIDEYPYQMQQAQKWKALADVLSDLELFDFMWRNNLKYEWMRYWRSLDVRVEPQASYKAKIDAEQKIQGKTRDLSSLLGNIGLFLFEMGLHKSGLFFNERALRMQERITGPVDLGVAQYLDNQASIYVELGKWSSGETVAKRALEIRESLLGPTHPDTAKSLHRLAQFTDSRRRKRKLLRRALEIQENALGPEHPDVATTLNFLATLYPIWYPPDFVIPIFTRALNIYKATLGPTHPKVALVLQNVAVFYNEGHQMYLEAELHFKSALAIYESALGPNHPDVANSLNNLAMVYGWQDRYGEALQLLERALSIWKATYGINHHLTATALNNMGSVCSYKGDFDKALSFKKQALEVYQQLYGYGPTITRAQYEVAAVARKSGQLKKAQRFYEQAMTPDKESAEFLQGPFFYIYMILGPLSLIGGSALLMHGKGLDLITGAFLILLGLISLAVIVTTVMPVFFRPITALEYYGTIISIALINIRSIPLGKRALRSIEYKRGPDHVDVAIFLNKLAENYCKVERYTEAIPLYRRAVKICEAVLGKNHPEAQRYKTKLIWCRETMRKV